MFQMELAGHSFAVENTYPYVEKLCRDYRTDKEPEAVIRISLAEIERENTQGGAWSYAYLESLAVYRKICERLLDADILLFHCSAIEIDGKAYLFAAPSGTGKSTHTRLWREVFGDRVTMINDDKPLLYIPEDGKVGEPESGNLENGMPYGGKFWEEKWESKKPENGILVYGTPYGGKEGLQSNTSAPVAAIVFLHQAEENTIQRLDAGSAYPKLLNQIYRRSDADGMKKTLELTGRLAKLPVYALGCTISKEAVKLAYDTIVPKETR